MNIKRTALLALTLIFALSACGRSQKATIPEGACDGLMQSILSIQETLPEMTLLEYGVTEDFSTYFQTCYGIWEESITDAAMTVATGLTAVEFAVVEVADQDAAGRILDAFRAYQVSRLGAFTGYAPEAAEMVEEGYVARQGNYVILAFCDDEDDVEELVEEGTLYSVSVLSPTAQYGVQVETAQPEVETSAPTEIYTSVESGKTFTLYDNTAIVTAYQTGDPSGLDEEERVVYDACTAFLAEHITAGMSDYDKELTAHDYLLTICDYAAEAVGRDWMDYLQYTTPYGVFTEGKGVCLGYANTFQLLMDLMDIPCVTVVGTVRGVSEDHAWNQVQIDGTWYWVDATWDDPLSYDQNGDLVAGAFLNHDYFNCTSDYLRGTQHEWDEAAWPEVDQSLWGEVSARTDI